MEQIARYKPGNNVPCKAAAGQQILAGHLVTVESYDAPTSSYVGRHTGAGARADGVAELDTAPAAGATGYEQERFTNLTRRGSVARVFSGAAIPLLGAAGTPVKSDATGRVIPQGGAGVIVGYAYTAASAADKIVEVDLL